MNILSKVDAKRLDATKALDQSKRGSLGQYFTSAPICLFMASLFKKIEGKVELLDPGCGPGSLTAAFIDETIRRDKANSVSVELYDIEQGKITNIY